MLYLLNFWATGHFVAITIRESYIELLIVKLQANLAVCNYGRKISKPTHWRITDANLMKKIASVCASKNLFTCAVFSLHFDITAISIQWKQKTWITKALTIFLYLITFANFNVKAYVHLQYLPILQFLMAHTQHFFFLIDFSMQLTVNMLIVNFLPMTGFEPWTSGIGIDHSATWAATTANVSIYWKRISEEKRKRKTHV